MLPDAVYDGVISCGTFTHGHVSPECLTELLRVTQRGALLVCGTIAPVRFVDIPIYESADHPHAQDRGLVMVFNRF